MINTPLLVGSLLALVVAHGGSAASPVETWPDLLPLFLVLALIAGCLLVVCIVGLLIVLFVGLVLAGSALGILSLSTLVAFARRRPIAGIRAFHYQVWVATLAPLGIVSVGAVLWLLHWHVRNRYIVSIGLLAGASAGLILAFAADRVLSAVYANWSRKH